MERHSTGGCDMVHHSAAERSHPKSEVRGRSREEPTPKGQRPRGVTPHSRSRAAAESTRLQWRRNCGEELPHVRVQGGRWEELPHTPKPEARGDSGEELPLAPCPRPGAAAGRSNPRPRPGVVTRGVTPHPMSGAAAGRSYPTPPRRRPGAAMRGVTRSHSCTGAGGPRGAIPH